MARALAADDEHAAPFLLAGVDGHRPTRRRELDGVGEQVRESGGRGAGTTQG
jgi:hypothetical protein